MDAILDCILVTVSKFELFHSKMKRNGQVFLIGAHGEIVNQFAKDVPIELFSIIKCWFSLKRQ